MFNGFSNCTLWSIIVVITLGKSSHRTPSGVRERHTCIGLMKSTHFKWKHHFHSWTSVALGMCELNTTRSRIKFSVQNNCYLYKLISITVCTVLWQAGAVNSFFLSSYTVSNLHLVSSIDEKNFFQMFLSFCFLNNICHSTAWKEGLKMPVLFAGSS
jgi:hypothetical protein